MDIIYTKSFDNSAKNLKRHRKELTILKEITEKVTNHNTFEELRNNPVMITIYKFKALRHQKSGFWSFNLEKKWWSNQTDCNAIREGERNNLCIC